MKNKKLILGGGFVGVILLGLVTNAIWDGLKPLTTYLFKITLNLSVLGIEKFKDNIYIEIAKGMHEGASLEILLSLHVIILIFFFATTLFMFMVLRKIAFKAVNDKTPTFLDKIYIYQKDLPRKSWFLWLFLLYMLFIGTIFTLYLVKQKYINNAVTNFEQLSKIVRPYVSEEESIKYISSFSQIKNKDDYANLVNKLQNIAKYNNQHIPEFDLTF
jgi:hypothetical protein